MAARRILLVEGSDDEHVLKHLCGQRGVHVLDEIVPLGGAERLLESFPVRVKASESGDAIGVIVDADTSANARWCSLRSRLVDAGYPAAPINPGPAGTIIEPPISRCCPVREFGSCQITRPQASLRTFCGFLCRNTALCFGTSNRALPTSRQQNGDSVNSPSPRPLSTRGSPGR